MKAYECRNNNVRKVHYTRKTKYMIWIKISKDNNFIIRRDIKYYVFSKKEALKYIKAPYISKINNLKNEMEKAINRLNNKL